MQVTDESITVKFGSKLIRFRLKNIEKRNLDGKERCLDGWIQDGTRKAG